jgi:hypothetical protein
MRWPARNAHDYLAWSLSIEPNGGQALIGVLGSDHSKRPPEIWSTARPETGTIGC